MLALGVILILVAAGALLVAVLGSSATPAAFELGDLRITMDPLWVFLAGAATVLLLVLGLELMRAGTRRANRRRKEKKQLNRRAKQLEARETTTDRDPATGTPPQDRSHADDGLTGPDRPAR